MEITEQGRVIRFGAYELVRSQDGRTGCELRKQGKHWKIVSLQPLEFFAPAKLDK